MNSIYKRCFMHFFKHFYNSGHIVKIFCAIVSIIILAGCKPGYREEKLDKISPEYKKELRKLYNECRLSGKIRFDIFRHALIGSKYIKLDNKNIITIIDFTKPSNKKRFFVIDTIKKKILFNTCVAHGKNTGMKHSKHFSNKNESKKSSLGFFKTDNAYNGKHGYSLRLDGMEKGINHNARSRSIVIHGADYVSPGFIEKYGRAGRSWGCPALPVKIAKPVIDVIKNGSCLYVQQF